MSHGVARHHIDEYLVLPGGHPLRMEPVGPQGRRSQNFTGAAAGKEARGAARIEGGEGAVSFPRGPSQRADGRVFSAACSAARDNTLFGAVCDDTL